MNYLAGDEHVEHIENVPFTHNENTIFVPKVKHNLYGNIFQPRTFMELAATINAFKIPSFGQGVIWRGQSSVAWPIVTSIGRRYFSTYQSLPQYSETSWPDFLGGIERKWLNEARSLGHDYLDGRVLTDLELLALFQHLEGKTRLLDFTWNMFTAIWFACREKEFRKKTGLLFGVILDSSHTSKLNDPDIWQLKLPEVLARSDNLVQIWQPRYMNPRMQAQHSVFVFNNIVDTQWSDIFPADINTEIERRKPLFIRIALPPDLKNDLFFRWSNIFGYHETTLFPDTVGFARNWFQTP